MRATRHVRAEGRSGGAAGGRRRVAEAGACTLRAVRGVWLARACVIFVPRSHFVVGSIMRPRFARSDRVKTMRKAIETWDRALLARCPPGAGDRWQILASSTVCIDFDTSNCGFVATSPIPWCHQMVVQQQLHKCGLQRPGAGDGVGRRAPRCMRGSLARRATHARACALLDWRHSRQPRRRRRRPRPACLPASPSPLRRLPPSLDSGVNLADAGAVGCC